MKITKRNLLTVILAVLCAVAIALGVGFVMPKNENTKIANAASSSPFTDSELQALAEAAGYENIGAMSHDIKEGNTVNASKFGAYTVSFGDYDWYPVLATVSDNDIILTLWLKTPVGIYSWSDGSFSTTVSDPRSNDYRYSWIRAAINRGQTPEGFYYGSWGGDQTNGKGTSTQAPTPYNNNVKSSHAKYAPDAFPYFSTLVGNPYIVPGGDYDDDVWLPTTEEAGADGSWGCTATQWANNGSNGVWTRSNDGSYYRIYFITTSGLGNLPSGVYWNNLYGVRPAIQVKISAEIVDAPTANQTPKTYDGSVFSFPITFDSTYSEFVSLTGKDFSNQEIDASTYSISGGALNAQLAGTYSVTYKLNDAAVANNMQWCDETGGTDNRTLTFIINKKPIDEPKFPNGTYNGSAQPFSFDTTWLKAGDPASYSTGITYDGSLNCFTAVEAGTYTVSIGLVDTDNTYWSDKTVAEKKFFMTVDKAALTVDFQSSSNSFSFEREVSTTIIATPKDKDGNTVTDVEISLYYTVSTDSSETRHTITPDKNTDGSYSFDVANLTSTVGSYTLHAELTSGGSAPAMNKNYEISAGTKDFAITEAAVNYDSIVLQYKDNTDQYADWQNYVDGAIVFNGKAWAVQLSLPSYMQIVGSYSENVKTNADTYTMTVQIKIKDDETEYKFDKAADNNNFTYLTDKTAQATFVWTIEQKEIDLSIVPFEYSSDNGASWHTYDPTNPPEIGSLPFIVRVPDSMKPEGITSVTPDNYYNQFGPGTIDFDFTFTLDNNHKSLTGSNTVAYSMETTGKQIDAKWVLTTLKDSNGNDVLDEFNVPYYIYVLDIDPSDPVYKFINYEYYVDDKANGTYGSQIAGGLDTVIESTQNGGMGASSQNSVIVWARAYLGAAADGTQLPMTNGVANYVLKFSAAEPEYKKMTVGTDKRVVDVTAGVTSSTYGNSVDLTKVYSLTIRTTGDPLDPSLYTVALYSGNNLIEGDIKNVDFTQLDAGTYKIVFDLLTDSYVLTATGMDFEVKPVELVVPLFKDGVTMTFNGDEQSIVSQLDNFIATYMEFDAKSITEARDAGSYPVVINIKEEYVGNYIFVMPDSGTTTVKLALTDGESVTDVEISNNTSTASYKWIMNKYVIDTTTSSAWKFASDGASLNLPTWVKALTSGADPTLDIQILYYDLDGNPLSEYELKGGNKFLVAAYINPDCAEAGNFDFKSSAVDPMTRLTTSPQVSYTVPKGGAAAFLGNLKDFATKTFLGLPVWAWLLIALALLILLIIIIVVASKRRKNKEEREAKKEAKEEEKRRREEEREMAKAKQEAELEKIRAQAGLGMAGMGAASMAMPQQPVQQPMAQPQPIYVNGSADNSQLISELRAEVAELRAENRAAHANNQQPQQPMQQPQMQYMQQPVQLPVAMPQMGAAGVSMSDVDAIAEARANQAIAEAKAAQAQAKAAEAVAEAKAAQAVAGILPWQHGMNYAYVNQPQMPMMMPQQAPMQAPMQMQGQQPFVIVVDSDGNVKSVQQLSNSGVQPIVIATKPEPVKTAASVEESNSGANYPTNAVVTTTTTVDTTQKGKPRAQQPVNDGRLFDVDGFYDSVDE